jgi:hypothetical protein
MSFEIVPIVQFVRFMHLVHFVQFVHIVQFFSICTIVSHHAICKNCAIFENLCNWPLLLTNLPFHHLEMDNLYKLI